MSEKFNMLHVLINGDRRPLRISSANSKFPNMSFASVENFMFANVLPESIDTFDLVSCKNPQFKFSQILDKVKTIMMRKHLDEALSCKKRIKEFSDVLEMIPNESRVFLSDLDIPEGILVALGLVDRDEHQMFLTPRLSLKTSFTNIDGLNLYGKSIEKLRDTESKASPVVQAQHLLVQALQFSHKSLEEFIDKRKERTMSALIENVSAFLQKNPMPQSPKMDSAACSLLSRLHEEEISDPNVLIRLVQKHYIVPTREFNRNKIKLTIFESFVDHVIHEKNALELKPLQFEIPINVLRTKYLNVLPNMREELPASIFEKSDALLEFLNIPSDEDVQRFTSREIQENVKESKERTPAVIDLQRILLPQDTSIPFRAPLFSGTNDHVVEFQSVLHFILIRWLNYLKENDRDDFSFLLFENVGNLLRQSLELERDIINRRLSLWMGIGMAAKFNTFHMKTLLYHISILRKNHQFNLTFDNSVSDKEQHILGEIMEGAFKEIQKQSVIDESVVVNMFLNEFSTHWDKIITITSNHLSTQISSRFLRHIDCMDAKIQFFILNKLMRKTQLSELDIVERFLRKNNIRATNMTLSEKIVCFALARNTEAMLLERIQLFIHKARGILCIGRNDDDVHCFWKHDVFVKYIFNVLIGAELPTHAEGFNYPLYNITLRDLARLIEKHRNDTLFFRLNMFECHPSIDFVFHD